MTRYWYLNANPYTTDEESFSFSCARKNWNRTEEANFTWKKIESVSIQIKISNT